MRAHVLALSALMTIGCAHAPADMKPKDPDEFAVQMDRPPKGWTMHQEAVSMLGRMLPGMIFVSKEQDAYVIIAFARAEQGAPDALAGAIRDQHHAAGASVGPVERSKDGRRAHYAYSYRDKSGGEHKGMTLFIAGKGRAELCPGLQGSWPAARDAEMRKLFLKMAGSIRLK